MSDVTTGTGSVSSKNSATYGGEMEMREVRCLPVQYLTKDYLPFLTFFRLVIPVLAQLSVVVEDVLVVVVLTALPVPVPGPALQLITQFVVLVAVETLLLQREELAGGQGLPARHALEAVQVEDLLLGAHHIVLLAEGEVALVALGTEQSHVILQQHQLELETKVREVFKIMKKALTMGFSLKWLLMLSHLRIY